MNSKLESMSAAFMLRNSGASLVMQSCSVSMPASLPQAEEQTRMLLSEAQAITSLIGCNISAGSSELCDGSVTKVTGSLFGAPPHFIGSSAAFHVNNSGTKLFALGKPLHEMNFSIRLAF
jgi:hypothetical protein